MLSECSFQEENSAQPRLGPHACCGMFIATLQSRKLKLVTTCGLGASRQDRPTCGYNPPASASACTLVTRNLIQVKSESFCCCDFDFLQLAYTQLRGDIADSWLCCIISQKVGHQHCFAIKIGLLSFSVIIFDCMQLQSHQ